MARCTAPVRGHRTASGRAACPACGGGYRGYSSYGSYSSPSYSSSEQRGRPEQRRRVRQQRKAALVASRFVRGRTRLPRCGHSRRSATASRSERPCLTFGTSFSATRGTTGRGPPRSCTICSSHAVSRSGSARRTSSSARRCSAKSTRDWRSRESGSCW